MTDLFDFEISSRDPISQAFLCQGIKSFSRACAYVKALNYGRNADKSNLASVLTDNCGTCSSKHALIKKLAEEHRQEQIKLFLGMFRMNGINTPKVKSTLEQYQLDFIPEAHCYLKLGNDILDLTSANSKPEDFIHDLILEIEILPEQISDFKVNFHKSRLHLLLHENLDIKYSLDELWQIREQCIRDLAS